MSTLRPIFVGWGELDVVSCFLNELYGVEKVGLEGPRVAEEAPFRCFVGLNMSLLLPAGPKFWVPCARVLRISSVARCMAPCQNRDFLRCFCVFAQRGARKFPRALPHESPAAPFPEPLGVLGTGPRRRRRLRASYG